MSGHPLFLTGKAGGKVGKRTLKGDGNQFAEADLHELKLSVRELALSE